MLAKESLGPSFDLPEEVLDVLPTDPYEQLDVARKITSIALATRISSLETELSAMSDALGEKDDIIGQLQEQVESLDASLSDTADKLSVASQEKERLLEENANLANAVEKLNRDVVKLEGFRKTLMRSLQDDDGNSGGALQAAAKNAANDAGLSTQSIVRDDTATSSLQSQPHVEHSSTENHETDVSRPPIAQGLLIASQTSTPRFTPPGSPPSKSSSASPKVTSRPLSPRRHSISFAGTRGMFDGRASFSSVPSSHSSMGYDSGRARVDGKEFFRQVRSRLTYEQFGAFLANVKELNSHKQTREETLRKADEIFGPDNNDLYSVFEGLITRKA
ncbi:hypothetical protein ACET3Z_032489 [Daucus carota]